ncbi:unnamed protein product, partial [Schistosoma mattheei]
IRKVHNYALLGDSDTEFFDDDDEPVKFKKTGDNEVKSISKPSKTKKITKDTSVKQYETIQTQKEKPSNIINKGKLTSSNLSASHCETSESITISSHKALSKSSPSTIVYSNSVNNVTTPPSNKAFFPVTPSSGLRLGLSRTKRLRPLHANVRIA